MGANVHSGNRRVLRNFDHLLLDRQQAWPALRPDVVLQLGGRLTSKRAAQFLEWAAKPSEAESSR